MKNSLIVIFCALTCISYSCCTPVSVKKDLANVENGDIEDISTVSTLDHIESDIPIKSNDDKEVIVSKDNIVPLLRTLILACTHKKDPTYKHILKLGGKQLFKLAEKKIGNDKHMKGLLNIIKKYIEGYVPDSVNSEEEDVLAELAEKYLRTHKFRLLFPESLLLHEPEMRMFVSKMKDIGTFEGRQMNFELFSLIDQFQNFTSRMRSSFDDFEFFKDFSLDKLRKPLTSIGIRIDEYLPQLRNGVALGGLSMGSITALAAAGALISAPFFLSAFRSQAKEEADFNYINRRVSTGGFPPEQFVGAVQGKPLVMTQPQWMDEFEGDKALVYAPRKNPFYTEPKFSLHPVDLEQNPEAIVEDAAYNKYLKEYNEWLEQYHNALNLVPNDSSEYKDYYQKYKEWYAKYYNEQFGEDPPNYDVVPPSAYEENNSIPNMLPPPNNPNNNVPFRNIQQVFPERFEPVDAMKPSVREPVNPVKPAFLVDNKPNENTNFNVFHVEEPVSEKTVAEPQQPREALPTPKPLIAISKPVQQNSNEVYYHRANPKPVYIPNEQGFRPVTKETSPEIKSSIFVVDHKKEAPQQPKVSYVPQEKQNNFHGGFLSSKSESVYNHPNVKIIEKSDEKLNSNEIKMNDIDLQKLSPSPVQNEFSNEYEEYVYEDEPVPEPVPEPVAEPSTTTEPTKPTLSYVTSGVFKTTPRSTPKAETTPRPYFNKAFEQSVRVVTSTSVVTSGPFIKKSDDEKTAKKKITLTDLLKKNEKKYAIKEKAQKKEKTLIEKRIDENIEQLEKKVGLESDKLSQRISSYGDELPIYALDPFYGPRLSRTDAIFHQLSVEKEECREQAVCNMYKNPSAFTPLSDFLSRQLTVTYDQLTRPTVNDERILRFFKYLRAARAGQDGFDCAKEYTKCHYDTNNLSYKPIVSAYNKVSLLMNPSS